VSAAIIGFEGHVMCFRNDLENAPCYCCIYPKTPPNDAIPKCSENGLFAPIAGVIGSLQATAALKIVSGIENENGNYLIKFNGLKQEFKKVKIKKDSKCKICN